MSAGKAKTPEELRQILRSYGHQAARVMVGIMNATDAPYATRLDAAKAIMAWNVGKPVQGFVGISLDRDTTAALLAVNELFGLDKPNIINGIAQDVTPQPKLQPAQPALVYAWPMWLSVVG